MADLGPINTVESRDETNAFNLVGAVRVVPDDIAAMLAAGMVFYEKWLANPFIYTIADRTKLTFGKVGKADACGAMIPTQFKNPAGDVTYGIYGNVTYEDDPGAGLLLRLYSRKSGELLAETTSDGSGNYDFDFRVPQGYKYYVVAFDTNLVPIYNAKIRDFLDPRLI